MLIIPRERNMTRLYIELHHAPNQFMETEIVSPDFVMQRAKEILHPFRVEWTTVGKCRIHNHTLVIFLFDIGI